MQPDKTRAKMIAELESVLKDESAHIAKYKRTSVVVKVVGIAFLLVGLAIVGAPWNWSSAAAALSAAIGGFLAGVSVAYDTSLKSWPIIRTLLKDNALEILKGGGRADGDA